MSTHNYISIEEFVKQGMSFSDARNLWLEQGIKLGFQKKKDELNKEIDNMKRILLKISNRESLEFEDVEVVCKHSKTPILTAYTIGKGLPISDKDITNIKDIIDNLEKTILI